MKTIKELQEKKTILLTEFKSLVATKKQLYSNMPIDSAMSDHEKELNKKITSIASNMNMIVKDIQSIKRGLI